MKRISQVRQVRFGQGSAGLHLSLAGRLADFSKVQTMNLSEKYRPRCLDDVLAQDKAKTVIRVVLSRGWGGQAWWITGNSGTGKTTLAWIIAQIGADKANIIELAGREINPAMIAEFKRRWMYVAYGEKRGYALIVNDAHGLSKPVIEIFLNWLENLRPNVIVIFTTTRDGNDLFEDTQMDSGPFASRCINLNLASRDLCRPFAARVKEIARIEGLDGKPANDYQALLKQCRNNMRKALFAVQKGEMLT